MRVNWKTYNPGPFFDEIISSPGYARKPAKKLASYLRSLTHEELLQKKTAAELAIKTMGISFTVYSDAGNIDREWPMDIIPRLIAGSEWDKTSKGLRQRLAAPAQPLTCWQGDRRLAGAKLFWQFSRRRCEEVAHAGSRIFPVP